MCLQEVCHPLVFLHFIFIYDVNVYDHRRPRLWPCSCKYKFRPKCPRPHINSWCCECPRPQEGQYHFQARTGFRSRPGNGQSICPVLHLKVAVVKTLLKMLILSWQAVASYGDSCPRVPCKAYIIGCCSLGQGGQFRAVSERGGFSPVLRPTLQGLKKVTGLSGGVSCVGLH